MKTRRTVHALAMTLALVFCTAQLASAALPEFSELAQKAGSAVVNINTVKTIKQNQQMQEFFRFHKRGTPLDDFFDQFERYFNRPNQRPRKERSLGSGFIISQDGFIVTNNHVIAGADEVSITLQGAEKTLPAKIIGRDPETDLALLKVTTSQKLKTLRFGSSKDAKVGQWVMAIGNPFGLDHSVTAGIISAKGRIIGSGPFDDFIQTDASINPGNSGGPLLNLNGEVIGINTAIVASGQGIGFAIPSDLAKRVIDQLKSNKKVSRGWIGVTIQNMDENTAKALDLKQKRGALIASVIDGEPAAKAGMKAGDVVIKVEGQPIKDASALLKSIASYKPGERVGVTVWRNGSEKDLKIKLGERKTQQAMAGLNQKSQPESTIGLRLRTPNKEEARALGLDKPQGLLIIGVQQNSAAETAGLRPGDVILQANQKAVNSVKTFDAILTGEAQKKGVVLLLIQRQGRTLFMSIALPKGK